MKKAVILDTSAIMYRSHFALMGMRNSKGLATGATYGFVNTLEGVLKEFSPDYLVACLDVKRSELKRSAELETYKAHRESMPDDLVAQQEYIMSVLDGYRIPKYKIDGYEADDVMSTLATKFSEDMDEEIEVYVVTGDKDLAQLVNGKINIALLGKGDKKNSLFKYIRTNEDVIEYLGVTPDKIPDLFGLMGDSSDGIPGVSGIGPKTGVGWYIFNIVKGLVQNNKNDYTGEFINFMNRHNVKEQINYDIKIKQNKFISYKIYSILTQKLKISHNFLMNTKSDIYHFFNFIIPKNIKGKVIVTIYDTVFFSAPETMGGMKTISEYKYAAERSDLIITISESAKADIIKHFNIDEKKIKIVTPGIDLQKYSYKYSKSELENIRKKYNLPKNYILYLGTIEPRKNIERIVKAFKKYKKEINDDLKLVIVGRKGWKYDNIMKLIESMGTDIIITGYIDEEDKVPIYKLAQIFVFPSLYEGFGMPILEAMASKTPVITSNISSMPEVAGNAGMLVDPFNENEIFEAYKKILSDDELKKEMVQKGLEQAKKFEWKKSVEMLEKIYEEI